MHSTLARYVPLTKNLDSLSGILFSLISAVSGSMVSQLSGSEPLAYLQQKKAISILLTEYRN